MFVGSHELSREEGTHPDMIYVDQSSVPDIAFRSSWPGLRYGRLSCLIAAADEFGANPRRQKSYP
jgi:hypothetical protein